MEAWFKRKIESALRRLTFSWPPRNEIRAKAKVAPATYECKSCGIYVYDGTSKNTADKVEALELNLGKKVIAGKVYVDHIKPIIDIKNGFMNWDDYINGMFCSAENLQVLCQSCNKEKTQNENKKRREN